MKLFFSILSLFLFTNTLTAQKIWSFQDCVDHALANNLQIKLAQLNTKFSQNTVLQNKMDMYTPNVNVTISEGFNFANSINPLTFEFVQQNTNSTSLGFNIDWSLFEGLGRYHQLKASELNLDVAAYEKLELENTTKLILANNYLNVLLANEALQIARQQQTLTQNQFNNTIELVKAGVLADGDRFEVEALLANDEVTIINAENNLETALNQLKLLLQLDPFEPFSVENITVGQEDLTDNLSNPAAISSNAELILPNLKGAELKKQAAEYQLKAAKGSLSPSLSFSAYVGTNYFSASQEQVGSRAPAPLPIGVVGATNQLVFTSYEEPIFGDKSFGQQFGDNFNQNLRLNLFIPIFGKWQRMIAIDNAKINISQMEYDYETKRNDLQQDVFVAFTSLKAAKKQLNANTKNEAAANLAYFYAEEKYKVGLINSYEFETAKNRFITAQANLIQSKYEYIFKKLIVNFYEQGDLSF